MNSRVLSLVVIRAMADGTSDSFNCIEGEKESLQHPFPDHSTEAVDEDVPRLVSKDLLLTVVVIVCHTCFHKCFELAKTTVGDVGYNRALDPFVLWEFAGLGVGRDCSMQ